MPNARLRKPWSFLGGKNGRAERLISRRDNRTQPGVLTPGNSRSRTRPERAADSSFQDLVRSAPVCHSHSTAPLGRIVLESDTWGLKPQAESCYPFGISSAGRPFNSPLTSHLLLLAPQPLHLCRSQQSEFAGLQDIVGQRPYLGSAKFPDFIADRCKNPAHLPG
jgi:hypothetical protein